MIRFFIVKYKGKAYQYIYLCHPSAPGKRNFYYYD